MVPRLPGTALTETTAAEGDRKMRQVRRLFLIATATLFGLGAGPERCPASAYEGYTLFSPNNSRNSYLVNMNNAVVYTWSHSIAGGYSCYLTEDGSLWRPSTSNNSNMNGGAAAGIVERYGPNGQLAWSYTYSSNMVRSHHDIEPLPNGNVLLIAWERKTAAQAVQAGLDQSAEIWPDHIIEVQPVGTTGGNIVWEWHAWNHLIQDHDSSKDNYGVVGDHPELLDINLGGGGIGGGDWMHTNAVSYNPEWDQIVISSHNLNELYVIDHSTTTAEAAGHTGGRSGKGGDVLYRWGCPSNYRRSGPQVFDVVHCSYWVPAGLPGAGNLMAFNNRDGQGTSVVVELVPPADADGNYDLAPGGAYGPTAPVWSYTASGFYSQHLGGCQRLPNGNTFIVESTVGNMFEVNSAGSIQWSYNRGGEIARALRYGRYYPGLAALGVVADAEDEALAPRELRLVPCEPNPFRDGTRIGYELPTAGNVTVKILDLNGRQVTSLVDGVQPAGLRTVYFDPKGLPSGIYLCRIEACGLSRTQKLVRLQ